MSSLSYPLRAKAAARILHSVALNPHSVVLVFAAVLFIVPLIGLLIPVFCLITAIVAIIVAVIFTEYMIVTHVSASCVTIKNAHMLADGSSTQSRTSQTTTA
jgi:uncharacterized membrane protein